MLCTTATNTSNTIRTQTGAAVKTFYFHRATMAACARNFRPELTVLLACESDSRNLITPAEIDATTVVRNELVSKLMLMPVGRK